MHLRPMIVTGFQCIGPQYCDSLRILQHSATNNMLFQAEVVPVYPAISSVQGKMAAGGSIARKFMCNKDIQHS